VVENGYFRGKRGGTAWWKTAIYGGKYEENVLDCAVKVGHKPPQATCRQLRMSSAKPVIGPDLHSCQGRKPLFSNNFWMSGQD